MRFCSLNIAAMFFESHNVGDDFARGGFLREPIDDRHICILSHFDEALVVSGAQHDRVDIARQHARGIGHAFTLSDMGGGGIHDDRAAAQLAHGHIKRESRAHGGFFEHHSEHVIFAGRVVIGRALRLVLAIFFAIFLRWCASLMILRRAFCGS